MDNPAKYDFKIIKDDDFRKTFTLKSFDSTNYTVACDLREGRHSTSPLIYNFTAIIVNNGSDADITISLTDEQTIAILQTKGYYSIKLTDAGGFTETYFYGKVSIEDLA